MSDKMGDERESRKTSPDLERAQTQFVADLRAGLDPDIEQYIQRLPQYQAELREFAFYAETIDAGLPDSDELATPALSEAAQVALERIAQRSGVSMGGLASAAGKPRLGRGAAHTTTSIVSAGRAAGLLPEVLAGQMGVSLDLLDLLNRGAIDPATVPLALITRLADALGASPQATAHYLQGSAARKVAEASAAYGTADTGSSRRLSFLEAVRQSTLSDEQKQQWAEVANAEALDHEVG